MMWRWQLSPATCPCQMCEQWRKDEEIRRVQRVLNYYFGSEK